MQFVPVKSRRAARRAYPSAIKMTRVPGGFLAFFNPHSYALWRRERVA